MRRFLFLNFPTTNASSTRLPLGSLDLNTRVPNTTGTTAATPQRLRRTDPPCRLIWLEKWQGTPKEQKDCACKMFTTSNIPYNVQREIRTRLDLLSILQSGKKMSKRLGGIIGCKYKTSSWHLNGFPCMVVVTLGQQYSFGEKPTVILYTYIN